MTKQVFRPGPDVVLREVRVRDRVVSRRKELRGRGTSRRRALHLYPPRVGTNRKGEDDQTPTKEPYGWCNDTHRATGPRKRLPCTNHFYVSYLLPLSDCSTVTKKEILSRKRL